MLLSVIGYNEIIDQSISKFIFMWNEWIGYKHDKKLDLGCSFRPVEVVCYKIVPTLVSEVQPYGLVVEMYHTRI